MSSKRGLTLLLLWLCCCAGTASAEKPAKPEPEEQIRPNAASPLITISNETTRVSGPIADDGYVSYLAALRKLCKTGVTSERNVVVSIWQALGPYGELRGAPEWQKQYFKDMGIEPLPIEGDYFVRLPEMARKHLGKEAADPEVQELTNELWDEFDKISHAPWSAMDHPLLADWIKINEKPIGVAVEGIMTRDQYYAPLLAGDDDDDFPGMVVGILLPTAQETREVARFLSARAMYRLEKDDAQGAMKDLLACHRLARHYSKAPTLVEALVCYAVEGIASGGDVIVSHHAKLTAMQARAYQDELAKMPPPPSIALCIDVCERYMYLDCVVTLARKGPGAFKLIAGLAGDGGGDDAPFSMAARLLARAAIDWDEPMRMGNAFYDRMVVATRRATYKERTDAGEKISEDLQKLGESAKDFSGFAASLFSLKSARKEFGRKVGSLLCALMMPAVTAASAAEDRTLMGVELSKLAYALAAYHHEKGSYPEKLAELAPAYINDIPRDRYSGDPLIYRRAKGGYLLYSIGPNLQDDGGAGISSANPDHSVRSPQYPWESE